MQEEQLLNEYKKYDYLNQDRDNPLVKIFVSYIKPSFLFKSEILTPIHLGRAVEKDNSKDGKITEDDINWLHENCIGDDDFEGNISHVNRRVGFLTGTYWAWKNYEKLGNPKYFGSFGYRRLLNPICLENLKEFDVILPQKYDFKTLSINNQITTIHGKSIDKFLKTTFNKIYPNEIKNLEDYMNKTSGYFWELYIMKKNLFFDFCEWIFPLLFEYLKQPQVILNNNDCRDIGFVIERLTGFYLDKLSKNQNLKIGIYDLKLTEKTKIELNSEITKFLRNRLEKNHK